MFIYISHRDPVEAIVAARDLMKFGHYPFIPQLNKLVAGKTDDEWQRYFKMWMFRCDCLFACVSARTHEIMWAKENKIPVCADYTHVNTLKLPPYGELGRKFGEEVATKLPLNEAWRTLQAEEVKRQFEDKCGLGADPVTVGRFALQAWDRKTHG